MDTWVTFSFFQNHVGYMFIATQFAFLVAVIKYKKQGKGGSAYFGPQFDH